jgi:PRTRC genetic system protein B
MVTMSSQFKISKPVDIQPVAANAFVLYKSNGNFCGITEHSVTDGKLGLGRYIRLSTLQRKLAGADIEAPEILPENLLIHSSSVMAWHTGVLVKNMWFHVSGRHFCHRVSWPPLVWILKDRNLTIFALGRSSRPTIESPTYHAPLMNIDKKGELCLGSAQLPRNLSVGNLEGIEAILFDTNFTHINNQECLMGGTTNKGLIQYWRQKAESSSRVKVREMKRVGVIGDLL